jgi:hypothetical protein
MIQTLEWTARHEAAVPAGVVALGSVAKRLLARLKALPDEVLACLSVVAARDLLVVIARTDHLPWVDGARYCAPDPIVPGLWLPTAATPRLSADLLQTAVDARLKRAPVLLWNEPEQILPLDRPIILTAPILDWLIQEFD